MKDETEIAIYAAYINGEEYDEFDAGVVLKYLKMK